MELTVIKNQIRNQKRTPEFTQQLEKALIICADLYTGVNFTQPLSKRDQVLFKLLANEIYTHFADLELTDIKNAFSLASAKKINVDLTTYYGKFNASILGNVLTEYRKYKYQKIAEYEHQQKKLIKPDESIIMLKNTISFQNLLKDYFFCKANFLNDDFKESDIKVYWYESLIKHKIIKPDVSNEIIETAKIRVRKNLTAGIKENRDNLKLLQNFTSKNDRIKNMVIREIKYLSILYSFSK